MKLIEIYGNLITTNAYKSDKTKEPKLTETIAVITYLLGNGPE